MKKIVCIIGALLIGIVFNFSTETYAAQREHLRQNATSYTGSTSGHGATYGYYNVQYSTVAVKKNSDNNPIIPFGTNITQLVHYI